MPWLKGIAASTAFIFTFTSVLPSGWAQQPQRTSAVEKQHLRGVQGEEAHTKAGLEEALQKTSVPGTVRVPGTGVSSGGLTRREFNLGAAKMSAAALLASLLGITLTPEEAASQELPERVRTAFRRFLDARRITGTKPVMPANLIEDRMKEIRQRYRTLTGGDFSGFDFNDLFTEYEPRGKQELPLTQYGRIWPYGNALILQALVAAYQTELAAGRKEEAGQARTEALRLMNALVRLGKTEQALGFEGGYHFSYNTNGDSFIHPVAPTGNNLWMASSLYSAMRDLGDWNYLEWVNGLRRRVLDDLQVRNAKDLRDGLVQGGRYTYDAGRINPRTKRAYDVDDREYIDEMGYRIYRGNPNRVLEDIATEHQFDAMFTLVEAVKANQAAPDGTRGRLTGKNLDPVVTVYRRLAENINKLWVTDEKNGDHFVTGMEKVGDEWRLNRTVAVDNNSWAGILLAYNEEMAWKAIQYVENNFVVRQRIGDMQGLPEATLARTRLKPGDPNRINPDDRVAGNSFFARDFTDRFIRALVPADDPGRVRWTQMIHPEATFGTIHFLRRFAETTQNADRRKQAQARVQELTRGMERLQELYGGKLPNSTLVAPLFTTLNAITPVATALIVALNGRNFLMPEIPEILRKGITIQPRKAGMEETSVPVTEQPIPGIAPAAAAGGNFWAARAQAPLTTGMEESNEPKITRRGFLKKVGATGATVVGTIAAPDLAKKLLADEPAAANTPRPEIAARIAINEVPPPAGQSQPALEVRSSVTPSDRVIAPPTLTFRHPLRSALQGFNSWLEGIVQGLRRLLLGAENTARWTSVRSPTESILPAGQNNVVLPLNDFRDFLDEGWMRVEAVLDAVSRTASAQRSSASFAVDIGGFVDIRDYQDLDNPVNERLMKEYVVPFLQRAWSRNLKVYAASSARGVLADVGSAVRNLADALNMGFDPGALVLDWEIWAAPENQEDLWARMGREWKKQQAWLWFQAHERILNDVVPEQRISPAGGPTQVYTLVNQEFADLLLEVLREKNRTLPERLHLVLMAYDTPAGREAAAAASAVRGLSDRLRRPAGIAFNFEKEDHSTHSLHDLAVQGRAGPVVQETLNRLGAGNRLVYHHLPNHHDLINLFEHGVVVPRLISDADGRRLGSAAGGLGNMALGTPPASPEDEQRFRPIPETLQAALQRKVVEPRAFGFAFGPGGLGALLGAPWRNLNTLFGKGVWLYVDPDSLVWGPEAGITLASLRALAGTLSGGELEPVSMELVTTPLDEEGKPVGPPQRFNVLHQPDPVQLKEHARWRAKLEVKVRRPGKNLQTGRELLPIITNVETEVAIGYPGYGGTPATYSTPVILSSLQSESIVEINLGELKPGPSFFILKTRDSDGKLTGWVGPGVDPIFMARYTASLAGQYEARLREIQGILSNPRADPAVQAEALRQLELLGGDVTELQTAAAYQGDIVVPMSLAEFRNEAETRALLERSRSHGATHLSLTVPSLEEGADQFLRTISDPGLGAVDRRVIFGRYRDPLRAVIRIAHEVGLDVGIQVDAAQIGRLTDVVRSPEARERLERARGRGITLNHGLDVLKEIVQANEEHSLELDFFNLNMKEQAREVGLRQDVEKLMEMLDTLLIVTGPQDGNPTAWAQYAARLDAAAVTTAQVLQSLERPNPGLVQRARHRFQRAVFLEGRSLFEILNALDARFPHLLDSKGNLHQGVLDALLARVKVPSVVTLRTVGVSEALIPAVRQRAEQADDDALRHALNGMEDWAAFVVQGRAMEIGQAQGQLLGRLQRPLDAAVMTTHRIQQTRLLSVGDTRPEVRLLSRPVQELDPGERGIIRIEVKNKGNLPARFLLTAHLMGNDEGGNPAWPAASPRVERFVSSVLKPGESQILQWDVTGTVFNRPGRVAYRVLARDANSLQHKPGQGLGLSPEEAALARADGYFLVRGGAAAGQPGMDLQAEVNRLLERFEEMERLRRERTGEEIRNPEYQRGFEQRLREFIPDWVQIEILDTPEGRRITARPRPRGLRQHIQEAVQQQVRGQLEVVSLMPEHPELWSAKLLRQGLKWGLQGGSIAVVFGVLLGTYRAMKESWREARHQAKLRSETKSFSDAGVIPHAVIPGVGQVTEAVNLGREWSHYVGGVGSGWRQRPAHLHPEQGKVSRAFEAHGKSVIVLDDETEKQSQVVERTRVQRRHRFQRAAGTITFWSAVGGLLLGGLKLLAATWPAAAGVIGSLPLLGSIPIWLPLVLAGVTVFGLLTARAPPLQQMLSRIAYLPVDLVQARWANALFTLAAPIALVWGAWALLSAFVVPFAAAVWIPVAFVSTAAGIWAILTLVSSWGTDVGEARGWLSTFWRGAGAFGLAAMGVVPLAIMLVYSLPVWQMLGAAVLLFGLVRTTTRIFVKSDQPLQSTAEWLWQMRVMVRYGLILAGVIYLVGWVGPLLYGAWAAGLGAALPVTLAGLSALTPVGWVGLAAASLVAFFLVSERFQLGEGLPGWAKWPLRILATAGVVGAALFAPLPGFPAVWAAFLLKIGIFSYAVGQWGKAVELYREKPPSQKVGAALFRGVFLGVVTAVGLPVGLLSIWAGLGLAANMAVLLSFWLIAVPAALMISAWSFDVFSRRAQSWIHDQFESREIQRVQYGLAIQHLVESNPKLTSPLAGADYFRLPFSQLEVEFDRLLSQAYPALTDSQREAQREMILRRFNIRLSPDERPLLDYDTSLFDQAWNLAAPATLKEWHRGVAPLPPAAAGQTPAEKVASLSPDQQRVLNWYYWRVLAERQADAEVSRQSDGAIGLLGLPGADQEMAVAAFFNQHLNRHKDEIFNQDQGTALRAFGGVLWTGDLKDLSERLRRDDRMAVIMPALILSLAYSRDLNPIFLKQSVKRHGLIPGVALFLVMNLQVALLNLAVPLGFAASMVNRWGRGAVQGGAVHHTLRASADAGMEGYQSALGYVILVIGRWLSGLLFTLMEVYLGRWVGRADLEEYMADQYWVPKAGTIEEHIARLLQGEDLRSIVAAHYAAIIGEENALFDMGEFVWPLELSQMYWDQSPWGDGSADNPGVRDPETFGDRMTQQQLPGVVAWRTVPPRRAGGGHQLYPVRFEIVKTANLGGSNTLEQLSDDETVRLREPDGSLTYLSSDGAEVHVGGLGRLSNNGGTVTRNGSRVTFSAPVRRLSQEPGKFNLFLLGEQTKGVNAGAGLAAYLGMLAPRLEITQKEGRWRAQVKYRTNEQERFPEWEKARKVVQDPNDRQAGQRGKAGREAASEILEWRDRQILKKQNEKRQEEGKLELNRGALPQGEMGHNQVKDASGRAHQLWMNFWRSIVNWEKKRPLPWLPINLWWALKISVGAVLAGYLGWPGLLIMGVPGVTFLAHLWGRIHPISFIGNVPYNRLQGIRGHYDSEFVEKAFEALEGRLPAAAALGDVPADDQYEQELDRGEQLVASDDGLRRAAELYYQTLKYERVSFQSLLSFFWLIPTTTGSWPWRRFMHVEPRLADAIKDLTKEKPDNPRRARVLLEGVIVQALAKVSDPKMSDPGARRAAFEALKWITAGELMALGNRAIADQYSRSRDPKVTRLGDVNAQYGVPAQQRLARMMQALGYPPVANRSWTKHSDGALYDGVPVPSMMYTFQDPYGQMVERSRQRGDFFDRVYEIKVKRGETAQKWLLVVAPFPMSPGDADSLASGLGVDRVIPITPEGFGLLRDWSGKRGFSTVDAFLNEARSLVDLHYHRWHRLDVDYDPGKPMEWKLGKLSDEKFDWLVEDLARHQSRNPEDPVYELLRLIRQYGWNDKTKRPNVQLQDVFDAQVSQGVRSVQDQPVQPVVRRVNPLRAALDQRERKREGERDKDETVRQFYLRSTHLQPDLETVHDYMRERSQQIAEKAQPNVANLTVEAVDRYQRMKQDRDGAKPFVPLATLRVGYRQMGYGSDDFQGAVQEMMTTMERDGEFPLSEPMGFAKRWTKRWLGLKIRYSKETILLNLLWGVTEDQIVRDSFGRVVDLRWSVFDGHWDASEWRLTVGPYLWPGSTMGRLPLWMRRSTLDRAPPILFIEALRLLEMQPWLAVASGFNRLPSDMLSLPQLLTEDGRHGALNRFGASAGDLPAGNTLHPTMNAWNAHWVPFMLMALLMRKRDKATQRAIQLFTGMSIEQAFKHLFDHPLFGPPNRSGQDQDHPAYTPEQMEVQEIFPKLFGLQAFLRDEVATAGAQGAGTFSYGFTGYTASWLAGRRVGPLPPGHVAAYWKYKEYVELDRRWTPPRREGEPGLLFKTIWMLQRAHQPSLSGDPSPEDLLSGQPVDPWAAMSVAGVGIAPAAEKVAPLASAAEPEKPLPVDVAADQPPAAGAEEIQLEAAVPLEGSDAARVISISVAAGDRRAQGRAVVFDPSQVILRQLVNPDVATGRWKWGDEVRNRSMREQPGQPLGSLVSDPHQWGDLGLPLGSKQLFLMDSLQTNFWEPQGFLIVNGKLVAIPETQWSKDPTVFVLDAGRPGLRQIPLANGIPDVSGIQEAIVGPVLVADGQDVSGSIEQYRLESPDPNGVQWDPKTVIAAFSAIGRTADGRLIFLALAGNPEKGVQEVTIGEVARAMIKLGAVEAVLLGGSMDVQQWIASDGVEPGIVAKHRGSPHDSGRPLNAAFAAFLPAAEPAKTGAKEGTPITAEDAAQIVRGWGSLSPTQQKQVVADLAEQGYTLEKHEQHRQIILNPPQQAAASFVQFPPVIQALPGSAERDSVRARGQQREALEKLGIILAGAGEGSRLLETAVQLGLLPPDALQRYTKPTAPVMPVTGKPLLFYVLEALADEAETYGVAMPVRLVLHPEVGTRVGDVIRSNNNFGLKNLEIVFQGMNPALSSSAQIVLKPDGTVLFNPDGTGGVLQAALRNGGEGWFQKILGPDARIALIYPDMRVEPELLELAAGAARKHARLGMGYSYPQDRLPNNSDLTSNHAYQLGTFVNETIVEYAERKNMPGLVDAILEQEQADRPPQANSGMSVRPLAGLLEGIRQLPIHHQRDKDAPGIGRVQKLELFATDLPVDGVLSTEEITPIKDPAKLQKVRDDAIATEKNVADKTGIGIKDPSSRVEVHVAMRRPGRLVVGKDVRIEGSAGLYIHPGGVTLYTRAQPDKPWEPFDPSSKIELFPVQPGQPVVIPNGTVFTPEGVKTAAGLGETRTTAFSPVSATVTGTSAPVVSSDMTMTSMVRDWGLNQLPELRVVVVSSQVAQANAKDHPTLAQMAGKAVRMGDAWLIVLPEQATDVQISDMLMPVATDLSGKSVSFWEYFSGEKDTVLRMFDQAARGISDRVKVYEQTAESLRFNLMTQIVANLRGVDPTAVREEDIQRLEEALPSFV